VLWLFRRNIETIIDVAGARQIKVVLTTMPRLTDENLHHIDQFNAKGIDQENEVLRSIAYAEGKP